jgi:hypothetical protein
MRPQGGRAWYIVAPLGLNQTAAEDGRYGPPLYCGRHALQTMQGAGRGALPLSPRGLPSAARSGFGMVWGRLAAFGYDGAMHGGMMAAGAGRRGSSGPPGYSCPR